MLARQCRVVTAKIHCLANFAQRVWQGFTRLNHAQCNEKCAPLFKQIRRTIEHYGAFAPLNTGPFRGDIQCQIQQLLVGFLIVADFFQGRGAERIDRHTTHCFARDQRFRDKISAQ